MLPKGPAQGTWSLFWRKSARPYSLADAGNVGTVISRSETGAVPVEKGKLPDEITASETLLTPHDHRRSF